MFFDDEYSPARPKIAVVRDFLNATGSVDMNPFLVFKDTSQLIETFQEFSGDVKKAADKLQEVTGANPIHFGKALNEADFMAQGFMASAKNGESIEILLSGAFQEQVARPYFALRSLEKMEAETGSHCFAQAQTAMDGLAKLYALAKAVPLVYEQISQNAAPALAVA